MSRGVLVVMARQPLPGAVKTRLARVIGDHAACDLYRAFLCDLHANLGDGPWRMVWAVQPADGDLAGEIGSAVESMAQRGGDLAERMANAFGDLFARRPGEKVVMIGADLPHLPRQIVAAAFAALDEHEVAMVPTRDGGYGLLGLRREIDLFSRIEMGTAAVRAQTLARAQSLGASVALLEETFDVDEIADLRDLADAIARGEVSLPFTAAVLRSLP